MRIFNLLLACLLPFSITAAELPLNVGNTAPDWSLENKAGEALDYYEDSDGKVSVVLFWASSCTYCKSLMPHLEVVYRKYRSKGLKFYAINAFEDGKIDPVEFFDNSEFSFTMLKNGDSVAEEYGVRNTPGLYVVDKDKQVVYKKPAGVSDILVKQNVDLRIKQALAK